MRELSEQDDNRAAAVSATRVLMFEDIQDKAIAQQPIPGLQVVIVQGAGSTHTVPGQERAVIQIDETAAAQALPKL